MIVDHETFISIMRKYASKTSNVNIKSSRFIKSFNVLKVICRVEFESISSNFATMIAYTRRRNSWYHFIISIEWWVLTETMLILIFIFAAYCLNFRAINWFDRMFRHYFSRIEWCSAWCWLWCDQIRSYDWFKHRERSRSFSNRFRFWDSIDQNEFRFSFRIRHEWSITEFNSHNCCCLIERADSWQTCWWKYDSQ